eukprot:TRINITY_DN20249_c0_g1_i1.p1 TRINITY_DN20249_c0_g1~~TRINITY_DN20249_c0_g1_i1.p1  ORF type:complete len:164 (-),score=21.77 TRINITY_DN20249_c0_g1_i1:620-1111(-)
MVDWGRSMAMVVIAVACWLLLEKHQPLPDALRNRRATMPPASVLLVGDSGPVSAAMADELANSPAVVDLMVVCVLYGDEECGMPHHRAVHHEALAESCGRVGSSAGCSRLFGSITRHQAMFAVHAPPSGLTALGERHGAWLASAKSTRWQTSLRRSRVWNRFR